MNLFEENKKLYGLKLLKKFVDLFPCDEEDIRYRSYKRTEFDLIKYVVENLKIE